MTIEERKEKLMHLGKFLGQFSRNKIEKAEGIPGNDTFFTGMQERIESAVHYNGWFTKENVLFALEQWSKALSKEELDTWLEPYTIPEGPPRTVGIIMAGNIPLVGFHDFLSVLISGHKVLVKQSSNDQHLLPWIVEYLTTIAPEWKEYITFLDNSKGKVGKMENYDAVIATGSNNTARYFEYYFKGKPAIIRKNRNSVAILTGKESPEQLSALAEDIFRYYGLGCRNVSKLYVPEGYDFDRFFKSIYDWNPIIHQAKYANNYDYNKAVYLMSQFRLLENGFLILKEDSAFGSPIATLFYQTYSDPAQLREQLNQNKDQIQCVVSDGLFENEVPFGKTQHPRLWDYADNVDTLAFLTEKV